jgi:type VI secretion system protein ImpE
MTAHELFEAGRLSEAVAIQNADVQADPAHLGKRLFLFELLSFAGDLDRARAQLDGLTVDDEPFREGRQLLDAELHRRDLFARGTGPGFFAPGPEHVRLRLEAVERLREGQPLEASELIRQADDALAPLGGTLNGTPFDDLRDADDLFGPILEVLARGVYYWVPLEQVAAVTAAPPRGARDLLWLPARLTLADGQDDEVFLPALYPHSHEGADDVRLGRATLWKQEPDGPVYGLGARTYLVGEEAVELREWRQVVFGGPAR